MKKIRERISNNFEGRRWQYRLQGKERSFSFVNLESFPMDENNSRAEGTITLWRILARQISLIFVDIHFIFNLILISVFHMFKKQYCIWKLAGKPQKVLYPRV